MRRKKVTPVGSPEVKKTIQRMSLAILPLLHKPLQQT